MVTKLRRQTIRIAHEKRSEYSAKTVSSTLKKREKGRNESKERLVYFFMRTIFDLAVVNEVKRTADKNRADDS